MFTPNKVTGFYRNNLRAATIFKQYFTQYFTLTYWAFSIVTIFSFVSLFPSKRKMSLGVAIFFGIIFLAAVALLVWQWGVFRKKYGNSGWSLLNPDNEKVIAIQSEGIEKFLEQNGTSQPDQVSVIRDGIARKITPASSSWLDKLYNVVYYKMYLSITAFWERKISMFNASQYISDATTLFVQLAAVLGINWGIKKYRQSRHKADEKRVVKILDEILIRKYGERKEN